MSLDSREDDRRVSDRLIAKSFHANILLEGFLPISREERGTARGVLFEQSPCPVPSWYLEAKGLVASPELFTSVSTKSGL